ncbi:MAG: glycosyl hydrolase family 17 protein [Planctomycetota bacterium]
MNQLQSYGTNLCPASRKRTAIRIGALGVLWLLVAATGCTSGHRALELPDGSSPMAAVSYGPYRDGQSPDGASPTRDELLEDLRILSRHWPAIRMYGSRGATETVLELIDEYDIPMKVLVGAWIAPEWTRDSEGQKDEYMPEQAAENDAEVAAAVRLSRLYPQHVMGLSIGNETQVFWSWHRSFPETLLRHLRAARASSDAPITTADDFRFWTTEESDQFAEHVDFVVVHAYAMWNGQTLDNAIAWTRAQYRATVDRHPDKPVIIGELGWATSKAEYGEQGELIIGVPGEQQQRRFVEELYRWSAQNDVSFFLFAAFDEKWKGGDDPVEVEKHWGVFRSDRTPKAAVDVLPRLQRTSRQGTQPTSKMFR